jgi:hypothetical protein
MQHYVSYSILKVPECRTLVKRVCMYVKSFATCSRPHVSGGRMVLAESIARLYMSVRNPVQ